MKSNPPFMNTNLQDFFGFECSNQPKTLFIQNWLGDNYPDLDCTLMYGVPMYKFNKNNICFLQYITVNKTLELTINFGKGFMIEDKYNFYRIGPKVHKGIIINSTEDVFMDKIKWYINQSLELV